MHYWKLELACHKQPASFKPSFPQTIELWPQFTPSSINNQGERLMNKCFRVVTSQGSSLRVDSIQYTTNSLKFHCLLSAHTVRAVEALKMTRSCLNHLKLPKLSHCVSLWKTHSPLWRWNAPTSRTHHHLGPYPSPLFFCPLHSSAQNLLFRHRLNSYPFMQLLPRGQPSQHALSLCARLLTGRWWDVYKSLRFNLTGEEQRGVFQATATSL